MVIVVKDAMFSLSDELQQLLHLIDIKLLVTHSFNQRMRDNPLRFKRHVLITHLSCGRNGLELLFFNSYT